MSNKNAIIEFLDLLKAVEKEAADLYFQISQFTATSNPELSELFSVLAQEEIVHAKHFDMLKDFQVESENIFLEAGDSLTDVAAALEEIRKKSKAILARGQAVAENEAIDAALLIENSLMGRHGVYAVRITDESLRMLFQSLQFADAEHIQRLLKYLAGREKK